MNKLKIEDNSRNEILERELVSERHYRALLEAKLLECNQNKSIFFDIGSIIRNQKILLCILILLICNGIITGGLLCLLLLVLRILGVF